LYAAYERGDATADDVLVALAGYFNGLASKDAGLLQKGAEEDVAADFVLEIRPHILGKSFKGINGALFSTWARTLWRWHVADFWRDNGRHKRRFSELILAEDEEEAGQEDHTPIDAMSWADYRQYEQGARMAAAVQRRHQVATRTLELLEGPAKAVALAMLEGKQQQEIAAHVGLSSRYAVNRIVRKIRNIAEKQMAQVGGAS
jgi:DNA-directed RNA polymerase specialized sigma24 family protein